MSGLLALVSMAAAAEELLPNGIRLPDEWPPRVELTGAPATIPYLASPPAVIPIHVGRQLFVDDFLIEHSTLRRTFHQADYHPANPVVGPDQPWEEAVPEDERDRHGRPRGAWVFSDGVWYDAAARRFAMWYDGGFACSTCLATSPDGIRWTKPSLPVVPGTNIVLRHRRDSSVVWLDHAEPDPRRRYKNFAVESRPTVEDPPVNRLVMRCSPDGVAWSDPLATSPGIGDRSTVFYNPFRRVWVASIRATNARLGRVRAYAEHADPAALVEQLPGLADWTGLDRLDPPHPAIGKQPDLYTLDAVAYESLLLGSFCILRGGVADGTKKVDIGIGFSRDGFHWDRPDRTPLLPNAERPDAWNWGYMHSAGGVCLVVGDKLYFYACGRMPTPNGAAGLEKGARTYSTGLATLRRDGFASLDAGTEEGSLTTRPLRFKGTHLFVNVAADGGRLEVEALDEAGRVIEPFTRANCEAVCVDRTLVPVRWRGSADLATLAGRSVRFRFHLRAGSLFAFWVTPDASGASHGYVAAGGPGFVGPIDTAGRQAYESAAALDR